MSRFSDGLFCGFRYGAPSVLSSRGLPVPAPVPSPPPPPASAAAAVRVPKPPAAKARKSSDPAEKDRASRFRGVSWDRRAAKWKAEIREVDPNRMPPPGAYPSGKGSASSGGAKTRLRLVDCCDDEEQAARSYDAECRRLYGVEAVPNFRNEEEQRRFEKQEAAAKRGQGHGSQYRGVSWHKAQGKWQAAVQCNMKPKSLGYFVDEEVRLACGCFWQLFSLLIFSLLAFARVLTLVCVW